MSVLSLAILFGILIVIRSSEKALPPKNDIKQFLDECKMTENASNDDVTAFLNHKSAENLNAKCLLACLYEKSGVVSSIQIYFLRK